MEKIEISQHIKYSCSFCVKTGTKRHATGIWRCGSCTKQWLAGHRPIVLLLRHSEVCDRRLKGQ
ncbi:Putative 60S ribosomal protein L37a [Lemmus lemmus]